jgi:hypothetical protein
MNQLASSRSEPMLGALRRREIVKLPDHDKIAVPSYESHWLTQRVSLQDI